jgi:hypothetical protein
MFYRKVVQLTEKSMQITMVQINGNVVVLVPVVAICFGLGIAKEMGHLSEGAMIGAVLAVVLASACLALRIATRNTLRSRQIFLKDRRPLNNEDFVRDMNASGDYARFCLIMRDGFACDCGIAPEMIHLEDSVPTLQRLCFDGFWLDDILFALETEFPDRAADVRMLNVFKQWKTITFRQCVEGAAGELGFMP